jgi:flavodoxin
MNNLRTLVCYSSKTGNTKKIAEIIYENCPFDKNILNLEENKSIESINNYDLIIIGYWVESGKANRLAVDSLKTIKNKKIALFGTAGTDINHPYVKSVIIKTESIIDNSNQLLGHFICQGEIAEEVITNFEILVNAQPENKMLAGLLNIFKQQLPLSKGHPDKEDIQKATGYFDNLFNSLK